jgi:hypothetical protein
MKAALEFAGVYLNFIGKYVISSALQGDNAKI